MRLRKKKDEGVEAVVYGARFLIMLEAVRLAVLSAGAGTGTNDSANLRAATDVLAEKAMKGLSWPDAESS